MPFIVSPLKMILLMSIAALPGGMPSCAMRPPHAMTSSMPLSARMLPDISQPTSKPSVMPSCFITSGSEVCSVFTASVGFIFRASASRVSFTSVITT